MKARANVLNLTDKSEDSPGPIRLQAYLARCGVASRRASENFILAGRVRINGVRITELGTKVLPGDRIEVDNKVVEPETRRLYLMLNKPPLYICTSSDPQGRRLAKGLLPPDVTERVYNVGRLDYRSSGLILFTNDGDFAARVGHPSAEIEKEYLVDSSVPIPDGMLDSFREGVQIDDILYRCAQIERLGRKSVRVVLIEGKNREIRRVFSHFHLHPERLHRLRVGTVLLGDLSEGATRPLTAAEIDSLLSASKGV
jgi:23S rRNA pseudouridine2605 synthase